MPQTAESVLKDLKNNKYAPVYFLQGDEAYYIDLITDYIEKNALQEADKGFNQVVMYGKDANIGTIITNARRFPMMAERQVIIVKEAQEVTDLGKEDSMELLGKYIKNPLPSTILVFAHKYKTLDGRKSLAKIMDKMAVVVTTKKLWDNQIPPWIEGYVKGKGFSIQTKAIQMLADHIGTNLERMANEIDKVLINFTEKIEIDPTIIQKYVGISKEYNVFELQKALVVRDVLKANQIVNYFEANTKSNPAIPVIAMLFSFFSKVLAVQMAKNLSESELMNLLKIQPFVMKEYKLAARNYQPAQMINNIHHLKAADLQAKGVDNPAMHDGQILKELVFKLLH